MGRSETRFLRGLLVAALAASLLFVPDAGSAQKKGKAKKAEAAEAAPPPAPAPAPADDTQAQARVHYSNGKILYEKGSYADAMAEFQLAYDLKPHPSVLKSIAECKIQMGDIAGAIATFEKFLADPEATKKEVVEAKIAELKGMMARVEITSDPAGASLMIDGAATDKVTPATIELAPGEHHVVLNTDGFQPLEKSLILGKGEQGRIAVSFAVEGTPTTPPAEPSIADPFADGATPAPADANVENESEGPPAAFWIAAAVAGVGLVSGTVFGTMALGDEKDFEDKKETDPYATGELNDIKDSGERNGIIADVSFGVAAAAAVVGVVVLVVHNRKGGAEKADAGKTARRRIDFAPVATGEAVGMATAVSF